MYSNNYLASRLSHMGSTNLTKELLVQPELGRRTSYADFFLNAERSAQFLADLGVSPGDRVLVYAGKSAGSIELYFGCLLAGAVYTPINPAIAADGLGYFIEDASPAVIVCDDSRYDACTNATQQPIPVFTINPDESGSFIDQRDTHAGGFVAVERQAEDPAAILYTSGTTGQPKGVVHTHGSLWSNAHVLTRSWAFHDSDVLLHVLPIFHLHGLFTAMNVLLTAGASCVYVARFDKDQTLDLLPQCSVMMGVPPFYMSLLEDPRLGDACRNMRVCISGSAPMLPQTHEAWKEITGAMILERYGMTECSMIASNPYQAERRPNSVGFPLEGTEIRIVDLKTQAELPNGEMGMIEIRGPNLFAGYLNKPEKTAEDMRDDGFFISGDIGRFDAQGYLHVLGRVKDAIFTTDGIVIPKAVEEVIDKVPGVDESAVISVPHPTMENVPVAIIVGQAADVAQVKSRVASVLAPYQQPEKFIVVEALPRNAMGKVQKAALRETYAKLFADALVA